MERERERDRDRDRDDLVHTYDTGPTWDPTDHGTWGIKRSKWDL